LHSALLLLNGQGQIVPAYAIGAVMDVSRPVCSKPDEARFGVPLPTGLEPSYRQVFFAIHVDTFSACLA